MYLKMSSQICIVCGINKTLDNYHADRKRMGGYRTDCKSCRKIARHEKYEDNKDIELKQMTMWRQNNSDYFSEWKKEHPGYFREHHQKKKTKMLFLKSHSHKELKCCF